MALGQVHRPDPPGIQTSQLVALELFAGVASQTWFQPLHLYMGIIWDRSSMGWLCVLSL